MSNGCRICNGFVMRPVPGDLCNGCRAARNEGVEAGAASSDKIVQEIEDEANRLRDLLNVYGDHRWKCAVSRAFRADRMCPKCDCGWRERSVNQKSRTTEEP